MKRKRKKDKNFDIINEKNNKKQRDIKRKKERETKGIF